MIVTYVRLVWPTVPVIFQQPSLGKWIELAWKPVLP
jgi:hypothetical protein